MMPNALKLSESVEETAKETPALHFDYVLIPASSGTIAAGVIKGICRKSPSTVWPKFIIHLGYSRSHDEVRTYLKDSSGFSPELILIDEEYSYRDRSKAGETPPWPCNEYYDLKAYRWWMKSGVGLYKGNVMMWNIG